jgi:rhamnosyl/mannosyltransferase
MRVVHLGKYYPPSPGGIETHTQTLCRAQAALGCDVTAVVVNHADRHGRDVTFSRTVRTLDAEGTDGPVRVVRVGRYANVAKLDVAPGLVAAVRREARRGAGVFHLHAPNPAMMLAALAVPAARPLVITHHSDIVKQRVLRVGFGPVERAAYRRAALVLSDSPGYIDGSPLLQKLGGQVKVLPLGLDRTPFAEPSPAAVAAAAELRARHPGPLWLCVGRLIYYKGFHVALAALKRVAGTLLVSGTGPLEAQLKRQADDLGVADRVAWLGRTSMDQLVGCYHAAAAFWFPSVARSEGFGQVQVEAMASGCPVINTAIPGSGVAWVSRHDREGLTVPVNDPAALAAAAERMVGEPGLRDRLAAAGRARAAAEFDWRVMGERSLALYREVG